MKKHNKPNKKHRNTRKLSKMKRRYLEKPTPDLKHRIESMEQRLNPKPKKKKKRKRKLDDDIDLETEYQKNRAYWEEYRRNRSKEEKRKEEERERKERKEKRKEKRKNTLPPDIQDFISRVPDKKIYNKLVLKHHPDKGGDEEMFKIINNHMNP